MARSSTCDGNYDVGYRPSVSSVDQNDHLAIETPENSPLSGDSFAYFPSDSEASNFSVDEHGYGSEPSPSPVRWPVLKPAGANRAVLSRLGMMNQQRNSLSDAKVDEDDDHDLLSSGWSTLHKNSSLGVCENSIFLIRRNWW